MLRRNSMKSSSWKLNSRLLGHANAAARESARPKFSCIFVDLFFVGLGAASVCLYSFFCLFLLQFFKMHHSNRVESTRSSCI